MRGTFRSSPPSEMEIPACFRPAMRYHPSSRGPR